MSSSSPTSSTWSDRRGIFQKGKDVHEPAGRHLSTSSSSGGGTGGGIADTLRRSSLASNGGGSAGKTSGSSVGQGGAVQGRRPSNSGLFGNLTHHKRGSEDYGARRSSHSDQSAPGGFLGNLWGSTFKGTTTATHQTVKDKVGGVGRDTGIKEAS